MRYRELERLICAGVISQSFRERLMTDPKQAAQTGYLGHSFDLSAEELHLITTVQADDFQQFAAQIAQWIETHRNGHHLNGNGNRSGQGATPEAPLTLPLHEL